MGESLRDQLIKAGLATEAQAKRKERRPRLPKQGSGASSPPRRGGKAREMDLATAYQARERQERQERADAERAEREAAARRRESRAAIRSLLERSRLNEPDASIAYHFTVGSKVKHLYVTQDQQESLAEGRLAIVLFEGQRHLVPLATGKRIIELDSSRVVILHEDESSGLEQP